MLDGTIIGISRSFGLARSHLFGYYFVQFVVAIEGHADAGPADFLPD
jgi:hypothetical protein